MNGSFGTLQSTSDNKFNVLLDNGNTVSFSPNEYTHFQLGYATTVHKSQGITVDQAFILATPHFDQNTSYVALSRHKDDIKLYTNTKDFKNDWRLHNTLSRKNDKLSTLDFIDPVKQEKTPTAKKSKPLSFFQRLKNFFTHAKEIPQPDLQPTPKPQTEKWINEPMLESQRKNYLRVIAIVLKDKSHSCCLLLQIFYIVDFQLHNTEKEVKQRH